MNHIKFTTLKLKTRTLLTFEGKAIKKGEGLSETDPTSSTATTTSVILPGVLFLNPMKKG